MKASKSKMAASPFPKVLAAARSMFQFPADDERLNVVIAGHIASEQDARGRQFTRQVSQDVFG